MEVTARGGLVYNHRDFWEHGAGAKGLDPAILRSIDELEFDNGRRQPALARWRFDYRYALGPFRQLSDAQQDYLDRRPLSTLINVTVDGVAWIADATQVCIGYAPRGIWLAADGTMLRND